MFKAVGSRQRHGSTAHNPSFAEYKEANKNCYYYFCFHQTWINQVWPRRGVTASDSEKSKRTSERGHK